MIQFFFTVSRKQDGIVLLKKQLFIWNYSNELATILNTALQKIVYLEVALNVLKFGSALICINLIEEGVLHLSFFIYLLYGALIIL